MDNKLAYNRLQRVIVLIVAMFFVGLGSALADTLTQTSCERQIGQIVGKIDLGTYATTNCCDLSSANAVNSINEATGGAVTAYTTCAQTEALLLTQKCYNGNVVSTPSDQYGTVCPTFSGQTLLDYLSGLYAKNGYPIPTYSNSRQRMTEDDVFGFSAFGPKCPDAAHNIFNTPEGSCCCGAGVPDNACCQKWWHYTPGEPETGGNRCCETGNASDLCCRTALAYADDANDCCELGEIHPACCKSPSKDNNCCCGAGSANKSCCRAANLYDATKYLKEGTDVSLFDGTLKKKVQNKKYAAFGGDSIAAAAPNIKPNPYFNNCCGDPTDKTCNNCTDEMCLLNTDNVRCIYGAAKSTLPFYHDFQDYATFGQGISGLIDLINTISGIAKGEWTGSQCASAGAFGGMVTGIIVGLASGVGVADLDILTSVGAVMGVSMVGNICEMIDDIKGSVAKIGNISCSGGNKKNCDNIYAGGYSRGVWCASGPADCRGSYTSNIDHNDDGFSSTFKVDVCKSACACTCSCSCKEDDQACKKTCEDCTTGCNNCNTACDTESANINSQVSACNTSVTQCKNDANDSMFSTILGLIGKVLDNVLDMALDAAMSIFSSYNVAYVFDTPGSSCNCQKYNLFDTVSDLTNAFDGDGKRLCIKQLTTYSWTHSPVVLAWENTPEKIGVVKNFFPKASEGGKDHWYIWRASEARPLLVYDPKKTGQITSSDQLFGDATFGKNWGNGFQALGSLDKNKDGKISGEELIDLSLWFDRNMNGKSDKGEVVDASSAGLTTLYFSPDYIDVKNGDIIVSKGFEREKDGNKLVAKALDWRTPDFSSENDAKNYSERMLSEAADDASTLSLVPITDPSTMLKSVPTTGSGEPSIVGSWNFTVDKKYRADKKTGELAPQEKGTLIFTPNDENGVSGWSMMEIPASMNNGASGTIRRRASIYQIRQKKMEDGRLSVAWKVHYDDSVDINNVGYISADGLTMVGVTTEDYSQFKGDKPQGGKNQYAWTSQKQRPFRSGLGLLSYPEGETLRAKLRAQIDSDPVLKQKADLLTELMSKVRIPEYKPGQKTEEQPLVQARMAEIKEIGAKIKALRRSTQN